MSAPTLLLDVFAAAANHPKTLMVCISFACLLGLLVAYRRHWLYDEEQIDEEDRQW